MTTDLNQLARKVHQANINWWRDIDTGEPIERNKLELLALVHSEISEAYDAGQEFDDKLPHRLGREVEMADAVIRLMDYAGGFRLTLDNHASPAGRPSLLEIHSSISRIVESVRRGNRDAEATHVSITIASLLNMGRLEGLFVESAIREKLEYNRTRLDHQPEHRRKEGGKKH